MRISDWSSDVCSSDLYPKAASAFSGCSRMMPPLLYTLDEDNVARVRLNRPERHNAFDAALISALHETFAGLRAVEGLRAVVLTGEGKSFSAGADLDYMREAGTWSEAENVADGHGDRKSAGQGKGGEGRVHP